MELRNKRKYADVYTYTYTYLNKEKKVKLIDSGSNIWFKFKIYYVYVYVYVYLSKLEEKHEIIMHIAKWKSTKEREKKTHIFFLCRTGTVHLLQSQIMEEDIIRWIWNIVLIVYIILYALLLF